MCEETQKCAFISLHIKKPWWHSLCRDLKYATRQETADQLNESATTGTIRNATQLHLRAITQKASNNQTKAEHRQSVKCVFIHKKKKCCKRNLQWTNTSEQSHRNCDFPPFFAFLMIKVMLTLTYAVQMLVDHDTLSGGGLHVPLHRLALSLFESKKNEKSVSPTKTKTSSFPQPPSFLRFSFITTQSPRSPVKHDKQPFFPLPPPPLLCTDCRKRPDEKASSSLDKSAFLGHRCSSPIGTGRQGSGRGQPCFGAVGVDNLAF